MIGIVEQYLPIFGFDAAGKEIRIESRPADHGQHFAIARVQRHHGAAPVLERQFGHCLQIQIDGELQILSGNGFLVIQHVALVAETVHFHAFLAIHAHQLIVVLALDAVLPDDSPWWKRASSGESNSDSLISPTYPMTCAAMPSRG